MEDRGDLPRAGESSTAGGRRCATSGRPSTTHGSGSASAMTRSTETAPGEVLLRVLFSGVGRAGIEAEMAFGQHYVLREGLMAQMRSFRTWEVAAASALPPDAVIFDNDGLLLDTESVWTRGEQDLFESRGLEFTLEHKQELVGTSAQVAAGDPRAAPRRAGPRRRDHGRARRAGDGGAAKRGRGDGRGARAGRRAAPRGIPLALVSNSPRAFIELALETAGMAGDFGVDGQRPRGRRRRSPTRSPTWRPAACSGSNPLAG